MRFVQRPSTSLRSKVRQELIVWQSVKGADAFVGLVNLSLQGLVLLQQVLEGAHQPGKAGPGLRICLPALISQGCVRLLLKQQQQQNNNNRGMTCRGWGLRLLQGKFLDIHPPARTC